MSWDLTARRLAPPSPLSLLLVLVLLSGSGALRPEELFPFGESWGHRLPQEGDDESSVAVKLAVPLRFYGVQFSNLYVGTNGIISTQDLPRETSYVVDDFPTDFPAIAPFLADIHSSHSSGRILYGGHLLGCAESGCLLPVHRLPADRVQLPPYPLLLCHLGASGRLGGGQAWGCVVWRGPEEGLGPLKLELLHTGSCELLD
eukprot:XP_006244107.1 PREDICTED: nidogen-2-like [Rattus norvegicus]